jgi:hypothetical protein
MEEGKQGALAETQRLLRCLITAPEGVEAELRETGDPDGARLAAVVREGAPLRASARLDVYANAYFYRIHDALKADFGALHAALGDATFHNLVTDYLLACPPTRFSLRFAGEHLAEFLARHDRVAEIRERIPWAGDLAALEWAIQDAFDAADADVLPRESLAAVPAAEWPALRFGAIPALRVLKLDHPAHLAREAFDRGRPAPALPDEATTVLVWRKAERVFHRALDPLEAGALDLALRGEPFGAVCERVCGAVGEAATPARALALLERWLENGLFTSLEVAP